MNKRISVKISYFLRHAPEKIGLVLREGGWVYVEDLLKGLSQRGLIVSKQGLDDIVSFDSKGRYSYDDSGLSIRANQGHSVDVDMKFDEKVPPDILYHGTAKRFMDSIMEHGIRKMNRHHVHLSVDVETAEKVGKRHGVFSLITVDAKRMFLDGYKFYLSSNGVWLTDYIPVNYIKG